MRKKVKKEKRTRKNMTKRKMEGKLNEMEMLREEEEERGGGRGGTRER